MDLEKADIRWQESAQRSLSIAIRTAIIAAIENGLRRENVLKPVEEIWLEEQRAEESRKASARSY